MLALWSILAYGACMYCSLATSIVSAQAKTPAPRSVDRPAESAGVNSRQGDVRVPLRRLVTLTLVRARLDSAIDRLAAAAGVTIVYTDRVLPVDRLTSGDFTNVSLGKVLTQVLKGTGVSVQQTKDGRLVLVKHSTSTNSDSSGSVVGRVLDAKSGAGVAGTEVFLRDTRWRTVTDTNGRYQLADVVAGSYTLIARRLGYSKLTRSVTVVAAQTDTADIVLQPIPARLDELVSTATGLRRRLDVANDITTINADSVMQVAPIRSVTDLLEGRVPGLTIQRTSGAPGDPARLRLRGPGSPLRSNDPVVVVDGIRIYAEQSAARSGNLAGLTGDTLSQSVLHNKYATPSPLDYLDPNSIETIEVLKGPSAATLYGQDAANGVILITTKKGKAGPTRWTANAEQGRTRVAGAYPDLLLRWGHLLQTNTPVLCQVGNVSYVLGFDGGSISDFACIADSVKHFQLLNDPALTVLDQGHRTSTSLGVSGGNAALTYAVTGSYQEELGLLRLPDYEVTRYENQSGGAKPPDWMRRPHRLTQWGVVSQFGARLGTAADLALTTNFSRTFQQRSSLEGALGSLMSTYLDRTSGLYYMPDGYGGVSDGTSSTNTILIYDYYERATAAATQFTNGLNMNWRPRRWLTVTGTAGLNVDQRGDEILGARVKLGDSSGTVAAGQGTSIQSTVTLQGQSLVPLGRGFQFRFAIGTNYVGTSLKDQNLQTSKLAPGTTIKGAVIDGALRMVQDGATFGWYVDPSISNKRFNLSTGFRIDGGSSYGRIGLPTFTFPPKFPKLGFSYLLSDEPWFPLKNLVQSLRVRVAYGRAARQPGITDRLRLFDAVQQVWVDGRFENGVFLQTLGNSDLRPERSTEVEGGFDADLMDSRMNLVVTGYRKTTDDALFDVPVARSVNGLRNAHILRNIGTTQNTGLELSLGAQLLRSSPITWGVQVGLSQRRDMVVKLGPGLEPFYIESGIRVAPGYPLYSRWSVPIIGYADANRDGVLSTDELVMGDTAVYVGQTVPNFTTNLSTTVSLWHGAITMNADFYYEDGLSQTNTVAQQLVGFSRAKNDSSASLAEQAASLGPDFNWIQVVNTFRFNSLAVAYRVPTVVARKLGAQTLNVQLQGSNLGLWTNYRGLDPNVNARATGNSVTDTGVLPQPRTWQIRVNASY